MTKEWTSVTHGSGGSTGKGPGNCAKLTELVITSHGKASESPWVAEVSSWSSVTPRSRTAEEKAKSGNADVRAVLSSLFPSDPINDDTTLLEQ